MTGVCAAGLMGWLWLLIVGIAVYMVFIAGKSCRNRGRDNALDVLKKRYAEGEITKEEFEEMKKDIEILR